MLPSRHGKAAADKERLGYDAGADNHRRSAGISARY